MKVDDKDRGVSNTYETSRHNIPTSPTSPSRRKFADLVSMLLNIVFANYISLFDQEFISIKNETTCISVMNNLSILYQEIF